MATITTLAGGAVSRNTPSRQVYYIEQEVDFAAAATAKGSALAATDVIEAITVPAGTMIVNAGLQVTEAADGDASSVNLDLGVTGVDPDAFIDGFDYTSAAAGVWAQNAAAFQPIVVGAAADTIDVLLQAATTAPETGKVRVWAVLMDVSERGTASAAARDTSL